jgi:hypothetical protein
MSETHARSAAGGVRAADGSTLNGKEG